MIALIAASLSWSGGGVRAEDASRHALADELLNVMNMKQTVENSFAMVKKMIPAQMKQMKLTQAKPGAPLPAAKREALDKAMDKAMGKMMDVVAEDLSWAKLKDDYVTIYAETFTADELKGLIAFYKSPAGRAFVAKQPELMERSMKVTQKRMLEIMPKIQALTKEAIEAVSPPAKPNIGETKKAEPPRPGPSSPEQEHKTP